MHCHAFSAVIWITLFTAVVCAATPSPADSVNVFMGTNNEGPNYSRGNQYPAIHTPFAMNTWSVGSADLQSSWFYDYKDPQITGIKLTHQVTYWGSDYASLDFMPLTGANSNIIKETYLHRGSLYQRKNEVARPYYYKNTLDRYGIDFEFAPSDRGAIFHFFYPPHSPSYLVFNGSEAHTSKFIQEGPKSIRGEITNGGMRLFFQLEFDRNIQVVYRHRGILGGIEFVPEKNAYANQVNMKLATSYISAEQAKNNLTIEIGTKNLQQLKDESKATWDKYLKTVTIEGGTETDRIIFYTSLYRVLAFPQTHWEYLGKDLNRSQYYSPYDGKIHRDKKIWAGNGFWDSYRAVWPLLTLLYPQKTGEMLDGWVNSYKDGGWTPRWSNPGYWECMVGTHTDIVFADALIKGIRNWDFQTGYQASLKNALVANGYEGKGRRYLERANFLGYVPWNPTIPNDGVGSRTIEDSINDFGISVFAKILGKADDYRYFKNRALAYTNLWDPETRFFRVKGSPNRRKNPKIRFDPFSWGFAWTEGNAWQYRFPAPHDGLGLLTLFGGRSAMESALDEIMNADTHFETGGYGAVIHEMKEAEAAGKLGFGQFALGNEPVHHLLSLFTYAGKPSKTQYWTRKALKLLFDPGINSGYGYPGDEDAGQMSAWFVLNAMGFYPASPATGEYVMGSPLFSRVNIQLENGRAFEIVAPNNDENSIYIDSAQLNGNGFDSPYLMHSTIMEGGNISLQMNSHPTSWGDSKQYNPTSITSLGKTPRYQPSFTADPRVVGPRELIDSNSLSTWLNTNAAGSFEIRLPEAKGVNCYTMTVGNNSPQSDPKTWRLYGANETGHWILLNSQSNIHWANRLETKVFHFVNELPFQFYRWEITENAGANSLNVAEVELRHLE